jgi:polysaccharide export outer membrane protein
VANRMQAATMKSALALTAAVLFPLCARPQTAAPAAAPAQAPSIFRGVTTDDYNQRLAQLRQSVTAPIANYAVQDYRIGPEDLLEISVFEAPELNRAVRVSATGEISLPLLGAVQAAGLTAKALEFVLQELLRHTYMKDPHVTVFMREMQSHPVSVFGAVKKPGVFQINEPKSLIEVLSMAEGLAEDAGDTVIVMRGAGSNGGKDPAGHASSPKAQSTALANSDARAHSDQDSGTTVDCNLKNLLESGDSRYDVLVFPGDVVKVARAGVVYVEGDVKKPGGFMLKTNENISVLQAVALAEGLTRTAAGNRARIIRTDSATGGRTEIPIDLTKVLAGGLTDALLRPNDIVFVPNSTGKSVFYGSAQAAVSIGSAAVYRW